jgi:hypothetical protein
MAELNGKNRKLTRTLLDLSPFKFNISMREPINEGNLYLPNRFVKVKTTLDSDLFKDFFFTTSGRENNSLDNVYVFFQTYEADVEQYYTVGHALDLFLFTIRIRLLINPPDHIFFQVPPSCQQFL